MFAQRFLEIKKAQKQQEEKKERMRQRDKKVSC